MQTRGPALHLKMPERGLLIALEGCDRAGKTSLGERLVQTLNSYGLCTDLFSFPLRWTPVGKLLDEYLRGIVDLTDRAAHLLFSANRWEKAKEIRDRIEAGVNVVVDRYAFSGAAFSSAKDGLDLEWCTRSDSGLPEPDLVCFLHVSPEEAMLRGGYGGERFENAAFQAKVNEQFELLMSGTWRTLHTDGRSLDDVYEELLSVVTEKFEENSAPDRLKELWA